MNLEDTLQQVDELVKSPYALRRKLDSLLKDNPQAKTYARMLAKALNTRYWDDTTPLFHDANEAIIERLAEIDDEAIADSIVLFISKQRFGMSIVEAAYPFTTTPETLDKAIEIAMKYGRKEITDKLWELAKVYEFGGDGIHDIIAKRLVQLEGMNAAQGLAKYVSWVDDYDGVRCENLDVVAALESLGTEVIPFLKENLIVEGEIFDYVVLETIGRFGEEGINTVAELAIEHVWFMWFHGYLRVVEILQKAKHPDTIKFVAVALYDMKSKGEDDSTISNWLNRLPPGIDTSGLSNLRASDDDRILRGAKLLRQFRQDLVGKQV